MEKIQTVKKWSFSEKDFVYEPNNDKMVITKVLTAVGPSLILMIPKSVLAAGLQGSFGNIHSAVMNAVDAGVVLVIIFAGCSWGLGHRTKALEILIGVCCGYVLARHATDIRDFLKGI